jgi:hypothetical protein
MPSSIHQAREISEREMLKQKGRIGEPCEHFSGCKAPSTHAQGYWYPTPAGCVMCQQHVHLGRGDRVYPDHPKYPSGWGG